MRRVGEVRRRRLCGRQIPDFIRITFPSPASAPRVPCLTVHRYNVQPFSTPSFDTKGICKFNLQNKIIDFLNTLLQTLTTTWFGTHFFQYNCFYEKRDKIFFYYSNNSINYIYLLLRIHIFIKNNFKYILGSAIKFSKIYNVVAFRRVLNKIQTFHFVINIFVNDSNLWLLLVQVIKKC